MLGVVFKSSDIFEVFDVFEQFRERVECHQVSMFETFVVRRSTEIVDMRTLELEASNGSAVDKAISEFRTRSTQPLDPECSTRFRIVIHPFEKRLYGFFDTVHADLVEQFMELGICETSDQDFSSRISPHKTGLAYAVEARLSIPIGTQVEHLVPTFEDRVRNVAAHMYRVRGAVKQSSIPFVDRARQEQFDRSDDGKQLLSAIEVEVAFRLQREITFEMLTT